MSPPRFSILTPVYDTPAEILWAMLESVRAQSFGDWELCLVDDLSPSPHVLAMLEGAAAEDKRIRLLRREQNGGIVAASNDAVEMARGEFLALLDHDDELHPDALALVQEALRRDPYADYVYTDEDKIDLQGRHSAPFFKPDWSPERMRAQMYTCHLSVFRRHLVEAVGGFHAEYEGAQDWDLVLRTTERARSVLHVPRVLYHWRIHEASTAGGEAAKPWAYEAAKLAIQEHLERIGMRARSERDPGDAGVYRLRPDLGEEQPKVSIVIPTRGTVREVRYENVVLVEHCVRSILERSSYSNYEIVVVQDADTDPAVLERLRLLAGQRLKLVEYAEPWNFSAKINLGAAAADGEHLLLLNDDIEVVTPEWLERLVMHSELPGVGAVGAKLLVQDGRIQHAGIRFTEGLPGHPYYGFSRDYRGYANGAVVVQDCLAVTGACLITRREVFEGVGGFDVRLPVNYNDVDYCLKLRASNFRSVFDPDTVLYHFESSSRPTDVEDWEKETLRRRWAETTVPDPYTNPNLRHESPRIRSPFVWAIRRRPLRRRRRPKEPVT